MTLQISKKDDIDPVCGMKVDPATAAIKTTCGGTQIYFCTLGCKKAFDANPEKYLSNKPKRKGKRRPQKK